MASGLPDVRDPLFGLRIAVTDMKFDRTGADMLDRCGLNRPGMELMSWIFAKAQGPRGTFLVLGGLARKAGTAGTGRWIQDWKGELVLLETDACTLIDPPRESLLDPQYATVPLSDTVVETIARDAVARFTEAFGSTAAFAAALRTQGRYGDADVPMVLWQALKHKSPN